MIKRFLTLAPVRSPINLFSESVDDLSELIGLISSSSSIQEIAEVKAVDWPIGYGSLEHDALSSLFSPILCLRMKQDFIDAFDSEFSVSTTAKSPQVSGIEVLVYDDSLSIVIVDWKSLQKLSSDFQTSTHDDITKKITLQK